MMKKSAFSFLFSLAFLAVYAQDMAQAPIRWAKSPDLAFISSRL